MWKKIVILIAASAITTLLWFNGLERVYAHILVFASNAVVNMGGNNTTVKLETLDDELIIRVSTIVEGRRGSYPQRTQSLLLPAVIVFSWLPLLFFSLPRKKALRQSAINLGIFMFFQVIFVLLLTSYYNSELAKYLFHVMMETFYVFAIIIIIKDSLKYPELWKRKEINSKPA